MRDLEPEEFAGIELIRARFLETARIFDFSMMEPSPIESLATMEAKSGPAIRDEIYLFRDKGDREVALRFDFTVGLTRYVASKKSLRMPVKLATFGSVFRYDEPQKGRYRHFHQWNVEVYGQTDVESEAEVIEFTARLFEALGLVVTIDISHRKLVESRIAASFGSADSVLVADVLRAIDKTAKKSRSEILREFTARGYDAARLEEVLDFSSVVGTPMEVAERADVSELEAWDHIVDLFYALESRGVGNARVNLAVVRGLDYYSGTVMEVFGADPAIGALAGGGRYDGLAQAFGHTDFGAVGVAGGVERILLAMREMKAVPQPEISAVSVLYTERAVRGDAVRLVSALRRAGLPVSLDLAGRSLKKQMTAASRSRFAVIVGPAEIRKGKVVLRDMKKRTERPVTAEELQRTLLHLLRT